MTIGNISKVRLVPGKNAAKLVAFLPLVSGCNLLFESNDTDVKTNYKTSNSAVGSAKQFTLSFKMYFSQSKPWW
jgi:hypothetical protein